MNSRRDQQMEERAAIPPGLPPPNSTGSYWQNTPSRLAECKGNPSNGNNSTFPTDADIVIIGSGISGSTIAYNLLSASPQSKIVMLEARKVCSGATGRNGGHTKPYLYRELKRNIQSFGEAEAAKIARLKYNCMVQVHAFAREHAIKCDSWRGDTVDIFLEKSHYQESQEALKEVTRVLGEEGEVGQYRTWTAEQTREKFKVDGSYGAVSYASGSIQPYKFVNGVLELAISKGLRLWTETPAQSLTRSETANSERTWNVTTPRGTVRAKRVILATNGYTANVCPTFQGKIVPYRGHMTVQRPGSALPPGSLDTTYSFIYEDGYEYMVSRPTNSENAGDICIGGGTTKGSSAGLMEYGTTDDTTLDAGIKTYLADSARRYFGDSWGADHPDGRIRQAWTGIMGYSADGYPLVGAVPGQEGLYVSASFQGSGMVMAFMCSKALTSMILTKGKNGEDKSREEDKLRSWFPEAYRISERRLQLTFQGRY